MNFIKVALRKIGESVRLRDFRDLTQRLERNTEIRYISHTEATENTEVRTRTQIN